MKALFSTIIVSMFFFVNAFAQVASTNHTVNVTVPEVALISVVGTDGNDVNLEFTELTEAGSWFSEVTSVDQDIKLRLSSVKPGATRTVKVSASIPSGLVLKVSAAANTGGKGKTGTPLADVNITSTAANLITGIGSGYTGNSPDNGFPLTYALSASDVTTAVETLAAGNPEIEVTYTITE